MSEAIDLAGRKILIVDDTPTNIDVLRDALSAEGYAIYVATSGKRALRVARAAEPDLILLDVMMPEMDGFETCRRLRDAEETREVPVIFVTARTAPEDAVAGFRAGAVDYVSKPIQLDEVCARVRAQLSLRVLAQERDRAHEAIRQLAYATGKSEVAASVLHNIGNALTSMAIGVESLRDCTRSLESSTPAAQVAVRENVSTLMREIASAQHILTQLGEYGKPIGFASRSQLRPMVEVAFDLAHGSLAATSVKRELKIPEELSLVSDSAKLTHVLVLLIQNAIEACAQGPGDEGVVTVLASQHDDWTEVRVRDSGEGIDEETAKRVFHPGFSTKSDERGFGLHWCQIAVTDLGGTLRIDGVEHPGGELVLRVPTESRSPRSRVMDSDAPARPSTPR